jgi:serine/threonine-protein kinase
MSPEQARGMAVDKRTDIWAFGCVLYEMLTGRSAFAGETTSDSIARVLEREPDWTLLPAGTPDSIRRLLFRCLAKAPRQRLRDIGDVRIEIDALDTTVPGVVGSASHRPIPASRAAWIPWAAVIVLLTAIGLLGAWSLRPGPPSPVTRFTYTLPSDQVLNVSRGAHIVAVSPDGASLVYSGTPYGLYLRSMSQLDVKVIPGTESFEVTEPVFAPDGSSIAFFAVADQAIEKIAVSGGAPQMLCPVDETPTGITWGPGGILFGQNGNGIYKVSPNGGTPEQLVRLPAGEVAHGPQMLPDGEHLLFTLATGSASNRWDRGRIVVRSLRSQEQKVVIDGGSDGRYLPTGHLVFAISGGVQAVAFDPGSLSVTGDRVQIIDGVKRAAGAFTGAAAFGVSTTGSLVYVPGPLAGEGSALLDLAMMDRTGEVQPLHLQPGIYAFPNVSPDGTRVAFQSDDGREAIIYTYELSGASTMQRLTTAGNNRFPVWVSNRRVAFQSDRGGDLAVWWQGLDGVAEPLTKAEPGTSHAPESWAGDTLLYSVNKGTDVSLWTISLTTRAQARVETPPSEAAMGAVFSPDGAWVSYTTTQGSHVTMYVQGVRTGIRFPLSARGSDTPKHPRWSRDGKEILYNPNAGAFESARILAIDPLTFGKATQIPKRLQSGPPGSRTPYDLMPDGRVVGLVTAGHKEYVRGSANQIQIVLNWFEELKARARPR